ncbi:hypothetical protein DFH07DRAFT_934130 [Mycena maculata]|uniref:Uncharacterized protein n=1 Tax=Mycena maculata TaxID=230809 RepID=A0AAD7HBQ4_9AGAR|nr:hypothetical protein DFH07DRAFT_934130 [Mycena maculata]
MGGSAFSATLHPSAFPRMPPTVYRALRSRLAPRLQTLYAIVSTPAEAPEKDDHGDVDFLVSEPHSSIVSEVPHTDVQSLFNAKYVVPAPGNRTSSYAIPVERGEWAALGHVADEEARRKATAAEGENQDNSIYYQVDVHVCTDKAEWERIQFFHGYGDLGMIMGLVARNKGLHLGSKGLKISHPPRPPFELSESMDEILEYMGLSMAHWKAGFQTKKEVFEWVATSSLFDVARFQTEGQGIKKVKPERKMYAEFVQWAKEQQQQLDDPEGAAQGKMDRDAQIQHALRYFGKKEEFDRLEREDANKARLKAGFNGTKVREWTGLRGEQWKELKSTMDQVRSWVGGELGILTILDEQGEEGIKELILKAKENLGIIAQEVVEVTKGIDITTQA